MRALRLSVLLVIVCLIYYLNSSGQLQELLPKHSSSNQKTEYQSLSADSVANHSIQNSIKQTKQNLAAQYSKNTVKESDNSSPDRSIGFRTGLHGVGFNCKRANRGEVKKAKSTQLFRWRDENGKVHFGDRAPQKTRSDTIEIEGALDYFDLSINAEKASLALGYKDQLSISISKSYEVLSHLLPRKYLQKVEVNLWVFDEKNDYENFREQYAPGLVGRNVGFHNAFYNISAVHAVNEHSTMTTGIHESVHVMIGGIFGLIPRWLNEGLAEYLDGIEVYGQAAEIRPKTWWLHMIKNGEAKLTSLYSKSIEKWSGSSQRYLYARSWSIVYFLMSDEVERNFLRDYLLESAKKPCELLDFVEFVGKFYQGSMPAFKENYAKWLKGEIVSHSY